MDQNVIDDIEPAQEDVKKMTTVEVFPPEDDEIYYFMGEEIVIQNDISDSEFLFQNIIEEDYADEQEDNENDSYTDIKVSQENEVKINEEENTQENEEEEEEAVANKETSEEEIIDDNLKLNDEKHQNEVKTATPNTGKQIITKRAHLAKKAFAGPTEWKCILCLDTFPSERILRMHHGLHMSCTKCQVTFLDTNLLLKHFAECPKPENDFFTLTLIKSVTSHSRSSSYICDKCGQTFTRRYEFESHLDEHNSFPRHRCAICGLRFYGGGKVRNHMYTHMQPYLECKICNRKFKSNKRLNTHIRAHEGQNGTCSFCGQLVFSSKLTEHQDSNCKLFIITNSFKSSFKCKCEKCGQICLSQGGFKLHEIHCNGMSKHQRRRERKKNKINKNEEIDNAVKQII